MGIFLLSLAVNPKSEKLSTSSNVSRLLSNYPLHSHSVLCVTCHLQDVDDLMIRRFLRARELDIEKASALLLKYLSWRRSSLPNGFISPSEIPNELAQNKLFMQGVDKKNHPIVVVFGAKHKPYKGHMEEFKRMF